MQNLRSKILPFLLASLALGPSLWAQQAVEAKNDSAQVGNSATAEPGESPAVEVDRSRENKVGVSLLRNLGQDQWAIWSSPTHLRLRHLYWMVPVSGALGFLTHYDSDITERLPNGTSFIKRSTSFSNYGLASAAGVAGGMYLWGHVTGNEHARETGFLSGEAAVDAFGIVTVGKYAAGRERPNALQHGGDFRSGGASFPSAHAAVAFSVATVLAHEYPGIGTKLLSYGAATGISAARVFGRDHFVSDVAVGAAIGWFAGRQVYRAHHKLDLPGESWGTFERSSEAKVRTPADMGSAYVPISSWVYGVLDRLEALGYVRTSIPAMRPWTRSECFRLTEEAQEVFHSVSDTDSNPDVSAMLSALSAEFEPDSRRISSGHNEAVELESVYTRIEGISGPPLTDGYHFGQTIINDLGRPNREGTNFITGVSGRAMAGPFVLYVRGEYQNAPSAPAASQEVNAAIVKTDFLAAVPPSIPFAARSDLRLIEGYVGLNLHNLQITFGKQNLWWGPGEGSPMLASDNAEPFGMLRFNTPSPFHLPWIFKYFGLVRTEFFVGQLSGHDFLNTEKNSYSIFVNGPIDPQPFIHGQKISFKPSPNFSVSFSRTNIFGGPDFPFNLSRFVRSLTSQTGAIGTKDPGDNRSAMDMSYRVPGLRQWLTLYVDAFTEDQPTPLLFPERSAFRTGFFMPKLPGLRRLSLRGEAAVTDIPASIQIPGYHYFNVRYLSGYTNRANLMGSWVGRQGVGGQLWARYWFNSRNTVELNYRENRVSEDFLQGGHQRDIGGKTTLLLRPDLTLSASAQYERWDFPLLASRAKSNVAVSFGFSWQPHLGFGTR